LPYEMLPILEAARRCGLCLNPKTLRRREVEATCPFCGDSGQGKYHLSLNTDMNVFRCNLCKASGNSVSLMARMEGISNKEAYDRLAEEGGIYRFPTQPISTKPAEPEPCDIERRHMVYSAMLQHMTLTSEHQENLQQRGLSFERIENRQYKSVPSPREQRILATKLSHFFDLSGVPGFHAKYGYWDMYAPAGFFVPVRDHLERIQALQIRIDEASKRKYRWFSTREFPAGTKSNSPIHVTGNKNSRHAFLTEGGLKGDVASYLDGDALFLCIAGINNINELDKVLLLLGIERLTIALDMDKISNPHVRSAIDDIKQLVKRSACRTAVEVKSWPWSNQTKGIDNYYLYQLQQAA
jgi:DNA primase (bacterial type)